MRVDKFYIYKNATIPTTSIRTWWSGIRHGFLPCLMFELIQNLPGLYLYQFSRSTRGLGPLDKDLTDTHVIRRGKKQKKLLPLVSNCTCWAQY